MVNWRIRYSDFGSELWRFIHTRTRAFFKVHSNAILKYFWQKGSTVMPPLVLWLLLAGNPYWKGRLGDTVDLLVLIRFSCILMSRSSLQSFSLSVSGTQIEIILFVSRDHRWPLAKANRKDENGKGEWIQMGMFHPKNSLVVIIKWLLIVLN